MIELTVLHSVYPSKSSENYRGYLLEVNAHGARKGGWMGMVTIHHNRATQWAIVCELSSTYAAAIEGALAYGRQMVDGDKCGLVI